MRIEISMLRDRTEKMIFRQADRIASEKENLDALSWDRVEAIALKLRSCAQLNEEQSELVRELIAIAKSNESLEVRLDRSIATDDVSTMHAEQPTQPSVVAGSTEQANAVPTSIAPDASKRSIETSANITTKNASGAAQIPTKIPTNDATRQLPDWAQENAQTGEIAQFFGQHHERDNDVVVIPRGDTNAAASLKDTRSVLEPKQTPEATPSSAVVPVIRVAVSQDEMPSAPAASDTGEIGRSCVAYVVDGCAYISYDRKATQQHGATQQQNGAQQLSATQQQKPKIAVTDEETIRRAAMLNAHASSSDECDAQYAMA